MAASASSARPTQSGFAAVARAYLPALRWSLEHRGRVVLISVAILLVTAALVPRLGSELIPQLSQGEFIADLRLAPGTPLENTDRAMAAAQARGDGAAGNRPFVCGYRHRQPPRRQPHRCRREHGPALRHAQAGLRSGRGTGRDRCPAWQVRLAGRRAVPVQPAGTVHLRVAAGGDDHGYDLDRLRLVAEQVRLGMQASPTFSDIKSTVESGNPEIQIVFDQERAAQLGITVRELADRVVRQRARQRRHALQAAREEDRRAGPQRRHARVLRRGDPFADRESRQRSSAAARRGRGSHGRDRARRDPADAPAAGRDRVGQPVFGRPRIRRRRARQDRRIRRAAGRHDRSRQRTERRHEGIVPLAAVHDAAGGVPRLSRHGIAVRIAASSIRDPADHPARAHGLGLGDVPDRNDGQRRRLHRPHHAGRHRRQPVHRADRRGQPGARARPREA